MSKHPVISITGGTIWGNRGAESMLVTTIGKVRQSFPEARFYVFSYYPAKDRELLKDQSITFLSGKPVSLVTRHWIGSIFMAILKLFGGKPPKGNFFKIAGHLAVSDILLDIGGITFSDGREKFLPFNILTIWPAMILNVPVVKLAQAVGPFRKTLNRFCAKLFLVKCRHIFARGERTAEFLKELGYPEGQFDTVADIAFLFQSDFSISAENSDKVERIIQRLKEAKKTGKKVIVLSPSILVDNESWKKGLDYSAQLFDGIKSLDPKSNFLVVIPNATREGSGKTHNNDILMIERMRTRAHQGGLPSIFKDRMEWVDFDLNSASIRRIIGEGDALITSRYHAMISGLSLYIPTAVIGWGHKYKETMAYFGLERYSLDFGNIQLALGKVIEELLERNIEIKEKIKKQLPGIQSLAEKQFDFLKRVLS